MTESDPFAPAMQALAVKLKKAEEAVRRDKQLINALCVAAGRDELYPDASEPTGPSVGAMRSDQFYGKKLAKATREFLDMRQVANLGPASVTEIFDALKRGGYKFEASSDDNAKRGLRQSLTKNSHTFHRIPGGEFGLIDWYPEEKRRRSRRVGEDKPQAEDTEPDGDEFEEDNGGD